jgi:broad specificity phosphatase PhoE
MMNPSSSSSARILLVRHGQSVANAGGVTESHVTNPLTEFGWAQAHSFAAEFSHPPTRFVLSSFLRARQTAEPLLKRFPGVPVEDWPIHEFTYLAPARHNGTTNQQRMPHVVEYWKRCDPAYSDGPESESFSSFLDRARDVIRRLAASAPGNRIVLFTHGLWMHAFRLLLLFPHATDEKLMTNFRRLYHVNPIHNLDPLEFESFDNQIRLPGQQHLTTFILQGATSHDE